MTTIGKDFPVRSDAFRFSSEKRASSAATSPALTECFDIFSLEPGDSDVISQTDRLSSRDVKMQARWVWIAMGASAWSATVGMLVSRVRGSQPHSARASVAIHLPMGSYSRPALCRCRGLRPRLASEQTAEPRQCRPLLPPRDNHVHHAVQPQIFGALEPLRQALPDRLLDHPRPRK